MTFLHLQNTIKSAKIRHSQNKVMQTPKTFVLGRKCQIIRKLVFDAGKKAQNSKKTHEIMENI